MNPDLIMAHAFNDELEKISAAKRKIVMGFFRRPRSLAEVFADAIPRRPKTTKRTAAHKKLYRRDFRSEGVDQRRWHQKEPEYDPFEVG